MFKACIFKFRQSFFNSLINIVQNYIK
ncbi:unnamed protein product, partial [Vitis vinifera]|uniref:Uncharacterized protein n=1 Tax=Vitis vinifera TaxID=29760 RepID=D7T1L6_VITVI